MFYIGNDIDYVVSAQRVFSVLIDHLCFQERSSSTVTLPRLARGARLPSAT